MGGDPILESRLNLDRALDGVDDGIKLDEKAIAGGFNFTSTEVRHAAPDDRAVLFQKFEASRLVSFGKRAITNHVGKHDGGEPAVIP
jgi:hypothetical protein